MKSKGNPSKLAGKPALLITLLGIVIILGLVGVAWFVLMPMSPRVGQNQSEKNRVDNSVVDHPADPAAKSEIPDSVSKSDVQAIIARTGQNILKRPGDEAVLLLADLRRELLAFPSSVVSEAIEAYLMSVKEAVPTGVRFKLNAEGRLIGATSLRVFLLDVWNQADPVAAGIYARSRLQVHDDPDEWAINMRNFAMLAETGADRTWLQEQLEHFLGESRWQREPTVGYLHSFDGLVALANPDSVLWINRFLSRETDAVGNGEYTSAKAVNHAAFLALDQLIIADPETRLPILYRSLTGNPETIKPMHLGLLARADIRDSRGRSLLEDFLLNAGISRDKKETLLRLYPNTQYYQTVNLLSSSSSGSTGTDSAFGDSILQDTQTLEQVEAWLEDERFETFKPALEDLRKKLARMIRE